METGLPRVGPPMGRLVETEVDHHISLYDPMSARVHVLNSTASDTWMLSDGQHTAEQIVALLAESYGMDAAAIRPSVLETIGIFQEKGLLPPEDGTT